MSAREEYRKVSSPLGRESQRPEIKRARTNLKFMTAKLKRRVEKFLDKPGLLPAASRGAYNIYYLLGEYLIPKRRLSRRLDREFDSRFGVKTKAALKLNGMEVVSDNGRFATGYLAIRPLSFKEALDSIDIKHEDFVFVDFGSGMGRAMLLASEYPFKKITGIEFSPPLHRIAEENIRRYKSESQKCRNIESVCMDATQFQIPLEKTVFYFYNPFEAQIMEKVVAAIRRSLEECPREVFIFYINPLAIEVFDAFNFEQIKARKRLAVFKSSPAPYEAQKLRTAKA